MTKPTPEALEKANQFLSQSVTLCDHLTALEKKATGGKWVYDGMGYIFAVDPIIGHRMIADDDEDGGIRMRGTGAKLPLNENAELIASMRNSLPFLLKAAEWALTHGYSEE